MTTAQATASALIAASPTAIYTVLADYRNHHPHILPSQYFHTLIIEEGGHGAGTIFRAELQVFGSKSQNHMIVSEPQPGRVLVETDLDSGLATSFTLTPLANGQQCQVEIKSVWTHKPGPFGRLEAWMTGQVMRMSYRKELAQLAEYMGRVQL